MIPGLLSGHALLGLGRFRRSGQSLHHFFGLHASLPFTMKWLSPEFCFAPPDVASSPSASAEKVAEALVSKCELAQKLASLTFIANTSELVLTFWAGPKSEIRVMAVPLRRVWQQLHAM
eukprot:gnl/MRDRNA2_/MRDRNA2_434825_c0_seq1.p1 gnl/MRDRNA2_/MRDRNA2_434825_c0~~gnl/MRDRNA2_/MRDRNA2_434825_c0_seq1.p1  ORF type:complete len:136 (+),score=14.66 gnl/MRDRNA2_/MRDRNA2_434825_c0_seq1:53-409(+)